MQDNTLHTLGYQIYRGEINASEEQIEKVRDCCDISPPRKRSRISKTGKSAKSKQTVKIFNNKRGSIGDGLRTQTPVNDSLEGLREEIKYWMKTNFPNHIANDMVILRSESGCKRQVPHCDYEPTSMLATCPDQHYPCGSIVALQNETKIVVWPDSIRLSTMRPDLVDSLRSLSISPVTLTLNRGDVFVFRGDLVHAGAEYDDLNYRIHVYLDSPFVDRKGNRTWYPPTEEWNLTQ